LIAFLTFVLLHFFSELLPDGIDVGNNGNTTYTYTTKQWETAKRGVEVLDNYPPLPPECDGNFFKVVEIGTSNFDTHIQKAKSTDTGLSIDAMKVYIDQLPELKCWRKINRAVVARREDMPEGGFLETFFVPHEIIKGFNLPWWLIGCNSVGRPHPTAMKYLYDRKLIHFLQKLSVPVITIEDLLDSSGACRMGKFKVDVEGMDGELLVAYSAWVERHNRTCFADQVIGEFNVLSEGRTSFGVANETLSRAGYKFVGTSGDDSVWSFSGGR